MSELFEVGRQPRPATDVRTAIAKENMITKPWSTQQVPRMPIENQTHNAPALAGRHGQIRAPPRHNEAVKAPTHIKSPKARPSLAQSLKSAGVHLLAASANLRRTVVCELAEEAMLTT